MSDKTRKAIADRIKQKASFRPTKAQEKKAAVKIEKEPKST